MAWVRKDIGPIASPDLIQFAPGLPKTRSGKIMRRILRKIAEDEPSSLGDTSTLADPAVVDDLVAQPAEQEGRGGVRHVPSALPAFARRRAFGGQESGATERACLPGGANSSHVRDPLTSLSGATRPARTFPASVVFKSFTLFRTFPLLRLSEIGLAAGWKPSG